MTAEYAASILVVEDQAGLADAYTAVLKGAYDVRTAYDGQQALDMVDEEVDVVLLDRRMPGMSGDEVLAALDERGITAQVAMLTAVEPDVDIVEMPFDDYAIKPVDNETLLDMVEFLLARNEFTEKSQEFFRLAAKKRALESADREMTEEYSAIVAEMRSLKHEVDGTMDELASVAGFNDVSSI